jgi:hypothetical protein
LIVCVWNLGGPAQRPLWHRVQDGVFFDQYFIHSTYVSKGDIASHQQARPVSWRMTFPLALRHLKREPRPRGRVRRRAKPFSPDPKHSGFGNHPQSGFPGSPEVQRVASLVLAGKLTRVYSLPLHRQDRNSKPAPELCRTFDITIINTSYHRQSADPHLSG